MPKRPSKIRVGWQTYHVTYFPEKKWIEDHSDYDRGITYNSKGTIDLRLAIEGVPYNEASLRETLLHELVHACFHVSRIDFDNLKKHTDLEEHVAGRLPGPLLAVLRDNPNVLEYLTASD